MSTLLLLLGLSGCFHLGVAPPAARWSGAEVTAPIAEPDAPEVVRGAILAALEARGGLGGTSALLVRVVAFELTPVGRADAGLLYRATLRAEVSGGGRSRVFEVARDLPDPGTAAAGVAGREAWLNGLAVELAAGVAEWAVNVPAGPTGR